MQSTLLPSPPEPPRIHWRMKLAVPCLLIVPILTAWFLWQDLRAREAVGRVLADSQPVAFATVKLGDQTATTDAQGAFKVLFKNNHMPLPLLVEMKGFVPSESQVGQTVLENRKWFYLSSIEWDVQYQLGDVLLAKETATVSTTAPSPSNVPVKELPPKPRLEKRRADALKKDAQRMRQVERSEELRRQEQREAEQQQFRRNTEQLNANRVEAIRRAERLDAERIEAIQRMQREEEARRSVDNALRQVQQAEAIRQAQQTEAMRQAREAEASRQIQTTRPVERLEQRSTQAIDGKGADRESERINAERTDLERINTDRINAIRDAERINTDRVEAIRRGDQITAERLNAQRVDAIRRAQQLDTERIAARREELQRAEQAVQESRQAAPSPSSRAQPSPPTGPFWRELEKEPFVPASPIYNAIFSPTTPGTLVTLYDKHLARVRFFIGRHDPASAIPKEQQAVNPAILERSEVLPLVVTMSCLACRRDSIQKREITYGSGRSDDADFEFVPDKGLAREEDGLAQVIFDVSSQGIQYDHIVVNTRIVEQDPATGANAQGQPFPVRSRSFSSPPRDELSKKLDLVLTLFRENESLKVQIKPEATWLENNLKRKHRNANGQLKTLSAGSLSETEFGNLAGEYYLQLKALVEPKNDAIQRALSRKYDHQIRLVSDSEVRLQDSDRDAILKKMYDLGARLHWQIFERGESTLKEVVDIIENAESHAPLKIRIETNSVHLPWQLLHKPVKAGPYKDFWGLKYELSVAQISSLRDGRIPAESDTLQNADILFAAYRGDQQNKEEVALLAQEQGNIAAAQFGNSNVVLTTSSKDFLDKVHTKKKTLAFLFAYTHASSGTVLFEPEKNALVPLYDARGSRIIFEENDYLRPADLVKLLTDDPPDDDDWRKPYLRGEPIVFLNACETGTRGISPTTKLDFPGTFIDLGARGVIVTEAPVWKWFAYFFGKDMITSLGKGQEVSSALLTLRKKYMELGNPLGLLYSYYGNPNARMSPRKFLATNRVEPVPSGFGWREMPGGAPGANHHLTAAESGESHRMALGTERTIASQSLTPSNPPPFQLQMGQPYSHPLYPELRITLNERMIIVKGVPDPHRRGLPMPIELSELPENRWIQLETLPRPVLPGHGTGGNPRDMLPGDMLPGDMQPGDMQPGDKMPVAIMRGSCNVMRGCSVMAQWLP